MDKAADVLWIFLFYPPAFQNARKPEISEFWGCETHTTALKPQVTRPACKVCFSLIIGVVTDRCVSALEMNLT